MLNDQSVDDASTFPDFNIFISYGIWSFAPPKKQMISWQHIVAIVLQKTHQLMVTFRDPSWRRPAARGPMEQLAASSLPFPKNVGLSCPDVNHGAGIFTNIYYTNHPVMSVNIQAPWSIWDGYSLLTGTGNPQSNVQVLKGPVC